MAKHTAETYTDEELLALSRQCKADILAGGQSKSVRGKSLSYANLAEINRDIKELEAKIAKSSGRPTHTLVRRVRG